jgi:hypothetical protein
VYSTYSTDERDVTKPPGGQTGNKGTEDVTKDATFVSAQSLEHSSVVGQDHQEDG